MNRKNRIKTSVDSDRSLNNEVNWIQQAREKELYIISMEIQLVLFIFIASIHRHTAAAILDVMVAGKEVQRFLNFGETLQQITVSFRTDDTAVSYRLSA